MDQVEAIRAQGWTQGSVLSGTDLARTSQPANQVVVRFAELYVVASHPCDVVNRDLDREPMVDILPMVAVSEQNGNLTFGKNPRQLHQAWDGRTYEMDLVGRITIQRIYLASTRPVGQLDASAQRLFAAWLGSRYSRPAFADSFNERVREAAKPIARVLKKDGHAMSGIYLATTIEELPSDQDYKLIVLICMREKDSEVPALWADVNEAADQIADLLDDCDGIKVMECGVKSEADTNLEELRTYARWDYDSLTFKNPNESEGTLSLAV